MPSGYVVVYGHGAFDPSGDTPFFTVPADTAVHFITDALTSLYMDTGDMMGQWTADDLEAKASQTVNPERSCFNYEVGPDDQAIGYEGQFVPPPGVEFDIIKSDELLADVVNRHLGKNVVFAACRVVHLNDAGGDQLGVNQAGTEVEDRDVLNSDERQDAIDNAGEFVPQGVTQCVEVCPTCAEQCRWNDEHVGNYDHRCEQDHEWAS